MARRRMFQVGVAAALVMGLFGFAVSAADVTMSGSTTILPIAQAVAEAYAGIYEIEVSGGGSGVGITNLIDGTTMICDTSRALKPEEYAAAVAKGVYPMMWFVANDAISPIVNPANPVSNLTVAQLKDIYTGTITNWDQVGGANTSILVVSRDSSSGTYGSWNDLVLKTAGVMAGAVYTSSNADVANEVASNPNAIGYVGLGYLNASVKSVAVDGIYATVATALDRTFPIARPLFMVTNGFPSGKVLDVLMWILSDDGQRLVLEAGFAPIRALKSRIPLRWCGRRGFERRPQRRVSDLCHSGTLPGEAARGLTRPARCIYFMTTLYRRRDHGGTTRTAVEHGEHPACRDGGFAAGPSPGGAARRDRGVRRRRPGGHLCSGLRMARDGEMNRTLQAVECRPCA
ncbi:MAG: phosphate ABC transporter substrate-binding protein, partial [Candidatus Bipolaricaulota bacterium]|nr:phosphate ABC transporter substrate-binding protein [Candidatus Bipolaricaulota bacterium]